MSDSQPESDKGFINQLFVRRVPQYLGLYVAATWMAVEIGEWVVERFGLAGETTTYLFIGMATLLPSVALFAWGHGAPGVDRWTTTERVFLPTNFIAAILVALNLVQPTTSIAATETKVVVNEEGVEQVFEVPRAEYRRRALVFFWRNLSGDSSIDWMRYGLPWLLQQDLSQNMFVSLRSPMGQSILSELRERQITDALDVDKSLQIELARARNVKHVLDGEFDLEGETYTLTVRVYDTDTRREREQLSVRGDDVLGLIDQLSAQLLDSLGVPEVAGDLGGDLAVADFVTDSLPAIEKLVTGMVRLRLQSDFEGAIEALEEALTIDGNLAVASQQLAGVNFLMGRTDQVSKHVADALRNGHRLTDADKYNLKGLDYHIKGDTKRRVAVYRLWTERYPHDASAWETLGESLMIQGGQETNEAAFEAYSRAAELDPRNNSIPLTMANLEEVLGRPEEALARLTAYTDAFPDDTKPLMRRASIHSRLGQFEEARALLERATLIDDVSLDPILVLAQIDLYEGNLEQAEDRLASLAQIVQSPEQEAKVLTVEALTYRQAGRIKDYIDAIYRGDEVLAKFAPPLVRTFSTKFGLIIGYALIDDRAAAESELSAFQSAFTGTFAGFADFGYAAYYSTIKDLDKLEEYAGRARAFYEQYQFPMLEMNIMLSDGALAELRGDYAEASHQFQGLVDMVSQSLLAQYDSSVLADGSTSLARVQRLNGDYDDSRATLDFALRQFPGNPSLLLEQAYLQFETGDEAAARESLDQVLDLWSSADAEYIELQRAKDLEQELSQT